MIVALGNANRRQNVLWYDCSHMGLAGTQGPAVIVQSLLLANNKMKDFQGHVQAYVEAFPMGATPNLPDCCPLMEATCTWIAISHPQACP